MTHDTGAGMSELTKELKDLIALQGEIRVQLFAAGMDSKAALDAAGEILHTVARSPVASEEHRAAYATVAPEEEQG